MATSRTRVLVAIVAGLTIAAIAAAITHAHGVRAEHETVAGESAAGPTSSEEQGDESPVQAPSFSSLSHSVSQPVVITAGRHDTSPPLRTIPVGAPTRNPRGEGPENPARPLSPGPGIVGRDQAIQASGPSVPMPALGVSFDGVNNRNGVLPPDTNGDVGPTQYVQIVNLSFEVYDKTGSSSTGRPTSTRSSRASAGRARPRTTATRSSSTTSSRTVGDHASSTFRTPERSLLPVRRRLQDRPTRPARTTATSSVSSDLHQRLPEARRLARRLLRSFNDFQNASAVLGAQRLSPSNAHRC